MSIKNLSIVRKIRLSYFVIFVVTAAVSALLMFSLSILNKDITALTDKSIPSIAVLKQIQADMATVRKDEFSLLSNVDNPLIYQWIDDLEQFREDVSIGIGTYESLELSEEEKINFAAFKRAWSEYIINTETYNQLLSEGEVQEANRVILSSFSIYSEAIELLDKTLVSNDKQVEWIVDEVMEEFAWIQTVFVIGGIISVVFIILVSITLTRAICLPVASALNFASEISRGNLTYRLDKSYFSKDELGHLLIELESMQQNLHGLVTEINDSAIQLTDSVASVSAISTQTASGMESQQLELDSVASAMTEMQAAVGEVAQNTETAASSAYSAAEVSKLGINALTLTADAIQQVSNFVKRSDVLANELEQSSSHINVVVDVIRGIAEQTNLLALNAAIEAARAGEQGRGFAVVADEVRSLAQRTQDSTTQIVEIVSVLQEHTKKIGQSSTQCQLGIEECVEQVKEAELQIDRISHSVDNIAYMNTQIATACSEQMSVSEELNRSVDCINSSGFDMVTGTSKTAKECKKINDLSIRLKSRMDSFTL